MANGVNYEDERFTKVEEAKTEALNENEAMYDGMIDKSDSFYQAQIDASKEYAETQKDLMNQQTDFAVEQIEQQKAQAEKDYQKEQRAAYVDYQQQSNEYSVGAEQRAASGLSNTGYSESSQVAMYTAYQNRVATTKASYDKIVMNYNNDITAARLQNSSKLAELAYQTQQTQLELALQGFQYNNQLLLDKANKKLEIDNMYYGRFKDVLSQLNQENALAEEIRQFNAQMAEEKRQFDAQMAYTKSKSFKSGGGGNNSSTDDSDEIYIDLGNNGAYLGEEKPMDTSINWASVNALGYGPISKEKLWQLCASGEIEEVEKNGQKYYYKKRKKQPLNRKMQMPR